MKSWIYLIVHLRLHYQLLLAPIFLWGYFLAGGDLDLNFWLGFIAFHIFLYGGMTAYNSYYDRDEGPVGGLKTPPPVSQSLLPFSLGMQIVGAGVAALVNLPFVIIYLIIFAMGIAYSHPLTRLKGRPLLGLATVGIGQGILASLGGWTCALPQLAAIDGMRWIAIIAVTLITVGFYPLTQIYQIDEDRARGDRTFAVWAGPKGVFIFAVLVQGLAAGLLVLAASRLLGLVDAFIIGTFYGILLFSTLHWSHTYDPGQVLDNYRRIMNINMLTSLGFLGFVSLHLLKIL